MSWTTAKLKAMGIPRHQGRLSLPAISATCRQKCLDCNTSTGSYRRPLFGPRNAKWPRRDVFRVRSYALVTPARDLGPLHDASGEGWGLVSASGPTLSMGPSIFVETVVGPSAEGHGENAPGPTT